MSRIALALVLFLIGCASQQGIALPPLDQSIQALMAKLQAVSITGLQNAEAIAVANNDALMAPCYPAMIQFIQSFSGPSGTISDAFSAFETIRVTRRGMMGGLPDYLKLGCAAGVLDEAMFVTRLAGMLGFAATLGPIAPIVAPRFVPVPIPAKLAPPQRAPVPSPAPRVSRASVPPAPLPAVPEPAETHALYEMDLTDSALALAKVAL